jgi:hypothetical protein
MKEITASLRAEMQEVSSSLRGEMKNIRMEIQKLEYRMTIKMGSMMTVLMTLFTALIKLT